MRQVVLDTETTGREPGEGHRIIEIGCIELRNRRPTGRHFQRYLNPERDIDRGALAVHGLSRERLAQEPKFADIAAEFLRFIEGSELIIHNAAFDVAFLEQELARMQPPTPILLRNLCHIVDTLALARERHPGQRNSLDALCKRYGVDNAHRSLHGALLDARLLADVYLAMTGGQSQLALEGAAREHEAAHEARAGLERPGGPLIVRPPSAAELAAHAELLALLEHSSGGRCLWRTQAGASGAAGEGGEGSA
jgi:DNA polymerase-3 subunit epsilon